MTKPKTIELPFEGTLTIIFAREVPPPPASDPDDAAYADPGSSLELDSVVLETDGLPRVIHQALVALLEDEDLSEAIYEYLRSRDYE